MASQYGLGTFEGRDAIRGFFEDWIGAYEQIEDETEEILDLGNGVGFQVVTQRARPAGSTGEVHLRFARVAQWVEGMIERVTTYYDTDEARAAAERPAEKRAQVELTRHMLDAGL